MRNVPLRNQITTVLLILAVSFFLFTLFPTVFPHPEDFSPYAYVVAFLAGIEIFILIRHAKRRWFLLPILILCLLALLDETGYGSEVMNIKPFYSQTLHTEIRDLHNLITVGIELGGQALEKAHWNGVIFANFLSFDGLLLAAGLVFGWLLRFRIPKSEEKVRDRIVWLTSGFWFFSGLAAVGYLLSLPQDPKNAFLFGHSITRLLSLIGVFFLSTAPVAILISQRNSQRFLKSLSTWLSDHISMISLSGIILLLTIFYQFYVPFIFLPDQLARLDRITPLVLWLMAVCWFAMLGIQAWHGGLLTPITDLILHFANFLRREPAYFYMISAVFLILVAQLIDKGIIPLNTLIRTPNFHIKLWGLWTEETLEMDGAFLFLLATFYFPEAK